MRPVREDTEPWYRQFWPWFLISIPGLTIVGAIITINLAIISDDGLVKDDYYKEGLAVHKDAARVKTARQLGLKAKLEYDPEQRQVVVRLNAAAVGELHRLNLLLFHPTKSDHDQKISLQAVDSRQFAAPVAALAPANWQVSLEPEHAQWRISGRLAVPQRRQTDLE